MLKQHFWLIATICMVGIPVVSAITTHSEATAANTIDSSSAPTTQDVRNAGLACNALDAEPKVWVADWDKGEPETMVFCDGASGSLSRGTGAILLYQNSAWRCGDWENNAACHKALHGESH
jgi:hypothetical protein